MRQRVLKLCRFDQGRAVTGGKHVGSGKFVERPDGVGVEHVAVCMRGAQLKRLCREFDIDEAAGCIFQVPSAFAGELRGHLLPHLARIGEDLGVVGFRDQRRADHGFDFITE